MGKICMRPTFHSFTSIRAILGQPWKRTDRAKSVLSLAGSNWRREAGSLCEIPKSSPRRLRFCIAENFLLGSLQRNHKVALPFEAAVSFESSAPAFSCHEAGSCR